MYTDQEWKRELDIAEELKIEQAAAAEIDKKILAVLNKIEKGIQFPWMN